MNNTNTEISQGEPVKIPEKKFPQTIIDKIPPQIKEILTKFYFNKKFFWPVVFVFGLMFLVIVFGLLFGKRGVGTVVRSRPTPTPFVLATPSPCATGDTLCLTGNKLNDLMMQINSIDLKQSRLAPPQINYDISF